MKNEDIKIEYPDSVRNETERKSYRDYYIKKVKKERRQSLSFREKILEFFNGSEQALAEQYRMEHFWKPLWQLFVVCCIIYTILHIFKIGPLPDGY